MSKAAGVGAGIGSVITALVPFVKMIIEAVRKRRERKGK